MSQHKIYEPPLTELLRQELSVAVLDSKVEREEDARPATERTLEIVSESAVKSCSCCQVRFDDVVEQRQHYKLDWHRYNLKQSLLGRDVISEEQFTERNGELSSISGSDSESEEETVESRADGQGKAILRTATGRYVSLYKCLLCGAKETPQTSRLRSFQHDVLAKPWTILMLGGGHFAGAVFVGDDPVVHKTFHCYTVRAGQGRAQSSRDGKNAASAPKSAGASLRRYNEQAFVEHVADILAAWKERIESSGLVMYRAAGAYNKSVLFGKTSPLDKADSRLRLIPFSTRRPTFGEVKRVHSVLSSVHVYDTLEILTNRFPKQPSPEARKPKVKNPAINRSKSRDLVERPLPCRLSTSEDSDAHKVEYTACEVEVSPADTLQPFGRSVKQRQNKKEGKPKKPKNRIEQVVQMTTINGSVEELQKVLRDEDINRLKDENGNGLLHLACLHGRTEAIEFLLAKEADVCARNAAQETPYTCTKDRAVRDIFKRYAADNPDKYNYNKANIPVVNSTLTPEEAAEKKKQQKKAKREKEKEKRREKEVERKEQTERERFANLSDREKRALAAERRILDRAGTVISRCFLCGSDMSGKVPFEYDSNRFCTVDCLKAHRLKNPIRLS